MLIAMCISDIPQNQSAALILSFLELVINLMVYIEML